MPNVVQPIRDKVLAEHPEAQVVDRKRNSITHRIADAPDGRRRFVLDAAIGSYHYQDEQENWQEIDTDVLPSPLPNWDWEMSKSHWHFYLRQDGWFAARKKDVVIGFKLAAAIYLNIQTKEWEVLRQANYGTPTVNQNKVTWNNLFPNVDFAISIGPDGLHEDIAVSQDARDALPPPSDFGFPAQDTYFGFAYEVDWAQVHRLEDEEGVEVDRDVSESEAQLFLRNVVGEKLTRLPVSWARHELAEAEEEPDETLIKKLRKRLVKVGEKHYLLVGCPVLPNFQDGIVVFDPDIDEQVGKNEDDCKRNLAPDSFDLFSVNNWCGDNSSSYYDYSAGMRFQTVAVDQGATIDVSYLSLNADLIAGTIPETIIEGEDVDDAAAFSNAANYDGRDRTDASVTWTPSGWTQGTWYDSDSINTIVKEIVDRGGWATGQDMAFFWSHVLGWGGVQERLAAESYEGNSAEAPKLHIEYTAGGAPTNLTPSAVALSLVVVAPALSFGTKTVTPSPVAIPATIPAPTLSLTLSISPSPVAAPLVIAAPTLSFGVKTLTPSPIAILSAVAAPALSFGVITITPSPVAIVSAIAAPSITLTLTLTPSAIAMVSAIAAPTLVFGVKTLTPDAVQMIAIIMAPSLAFGVLGLIPFMLSEMATQFVTSEMQQRFTCSEMPEDFRLEEIGG